MAGAVLTRYSDGPGVSRRYDRPSHPRDNLDPLSQCSFSRTDFRELAELASDGTFSTGSRVCRGRKCFARSRNRSRTARAAYAG